MAAEEVPTVHELLTASLQEIPEGAQISRHLIETILEASDGENGIDIGHSVTALTVALVRLDRVVYELTNYRLGS